MKPVQAWNCSHPLYGRAKLTKSEASALKARLQDGSPESRHLVSWTRRAEMCRKWEGGYACPLSGCRYGHLERLPPPPEAAQMQMQPNSHVLFFGFSYLYQLTMALLCMQEGEIEITHLARCPAKGLDGTDPIDGTGHTCFTGWQVGYTRYHVPARNATLISVHNYALLQSSVQEQTLRRFLRAEQFDAAVFLQPHPDCFFRWQQNKTHLPMCVNLTKLETTLNGNDLAARKRAQLRSVFLDTFGDAFVEVLPWGRRWDEDRPRPQIEQLVAKGLSAMSAQVATAPSGTVADVRPSAKTKSALWPPTLDMNPLVNKHACCVGCISPCKPGMAGTFHQCMPGTPDLLAAVVVGLLKPLLHKSARKLARKWGEPMAAHRSLVETPRRYVGVQDEAKFGPDRAGWPEWVWSEYTTHAPPPKQAP